MILGRPTNLILGAFTAVFNVLILVLRSQGTLIDAELVAAVNIAAAALITLIANQAPTVNAGATVNVVNPGNLPNTTAVVTGSNPSTG